jgi:hypothetical protein
MAKKKYSINWEDDAAVSFEVNGVEYASLDDIPDEKDRLKLEAMMESTFDAEFDAEFTKMDKELEQMKNFPMEKVIVGIFTGIGILMLVIAGVASVSNIRKINREESVPGRVVEMVTRPEYAEDDSSRVIGEYYVPVVVFTDKNGERHQVRLSEGSDPPMYEAGDDVTILYEPEHPLDARIKSAGSTALMWILPGITGTLGIVFIGVVLAVQRLLFPAEDQAPSQNHSD